MDLGIPKKEKAFCKSCNTYHYEQFNFVEKSHQNSNLTNLIILDKMKNINNTATSIAAELNVSDTYVHYTFMQYVNLSRLHLPEVLCIDEVYMHFNKKNLYACVLLDWKSGEIVDILPNRFTETLSRYFMSIPLEERKTVKYLVSDMYDTYVDLAGSILPNAVSVIDCFHHTQPIIQKIQYYVTQVQKKYVQRDRNKLKNDNSVSNRQCKTRKDSREVYLLKKYSWLMTKNLSDISYVPFFVEKGKYWFYLEDVETEFMALDPNFRRIRELKEEYIHFTRDHINKPDEAAVALGELIKLYRNCGISMFKEFADTLYRHRTGIINSFIYLSAERSDLNSEVLHRLSNGLAEAYNNVPKDLKRVSNGVSNFDYNRNRLLWANRRNPPILAVPRSLKQVHSPGETRGPYKKKSD